MTSDRELKAEVKIEAPPERVWSTLTDLKKLSDWSPELLTMFPLKTGGLREGQWYVGVNRRKAVVWATRNVVTTLEPVKTLAWDTKTSGSRWIFELAPDGAGTKLTQRRPVPTKLTGISNVFARLLLGGSEEHADELEDGMRRTLDGIKTAAER